MLLEEVIAAHGGIERWEALESIRLSLRSGGLAFRLKGQPRAMRDSAATIATEGQHVVFETFPEPGHRGVFTGAEARIQAADGAVLARTDRPRGLTWSAVDMLAFAGAALWTYWARAANVVLANGPQDGLTIAKRRRVTPRAFNRPLPGPLLVWIEIA